MNRFIIKAGFNSTIELEKAKSLLLKEGVSLSDIDYISKPKKKGKGLSFEQETKAPQLALRFFTLGFILGLFTYFFSLFRNSTLDFWPTISSLTASGLLVTTLSFASAFLVIGYLIGRRYSLHTVKFSNKEGQSENILMSVNINGDILERSKEVFKQVEITSLETIDSKEEIEVGLRSQ